VPALLFAVAVVAHGRSLTYGALLERAIVSRTRSREGTRPGDRIAAMAEDRTESLEVYLASAIGGFPIVHVNYRLRAPEVAHIVRDAGSPHSSTRWAQCSRERRGWPLGLAVVLLPSAPIAQAAVVTRSSSARSPQAALARERPRTSHRWVQRGTTGFPKGAMISQSR